MVNEVSCWYCGTIQAYSKFPQHNSPCTSCRTDNCCVWKIDYNSYYNEMRRREKRGEVNYEREYRNLTLEVESIKDRLQKIEDKLDLN